MKVEIEVNIEHFRYSLIGNGYLLKEVKEMSEDRLKELLKQRIEQHIECEYSKSRRFGLLDED